MLPLPPLLPRDYFQCHYYRYSSHVRPPYELHDYHYQYGHIQNNHYFNNTTTTNPITATPASTTASRSNATTYLSSDCPYEQQDEYYHYFYYNDYGHC